MGILDEIRAFWRAERRMHENRRRGEDFWRPKAIRLVGKRCKIVWKNHQDDDSAMVGMITRVTSRWLLLDKQRIGLCKIRKMEEIE